MHKSRTSALADEGTEAPSAPGDFSFIRAAAGFVLQDGPAGGVFTGPETVVPAASATAASGSPVAMRIEPVERVVVPRRVTPKAPLAHRLMAVALVPFVLVAVGGLIMINRPSPRRPQPVPARRVATVPGTAAPTPATVPTTTPPVTSVPAPVPAVPTSRAPRAPQDTSSTPTTVTATTQPPTTTATTEPPTTTTTQPPTTTTTTEPPTTTTTTEPPTTTTTTQPQLTQQP